MGFGSALSEGSAGEGISHFTAVRMRVVGVGDLNMTMRSMDGIYTQQLVPFTMTAATNIQPTRLMNFVQQRAMLQGFTTEINEVFRINRIIIFAKDLYTSYPG